MALSIKSVPVLQGKEADDFVKMAQANKAKKGTIDFSQNILKTRKILAKSRKTTTKRATKRATKK